MQIEELTLVKYNNIMPEVLILVPCRGLSMHPNNPGVRLQDAEVDLAFTYEVNEKEWDDDRLCCRELDYAPYLITRPLYVVREAGEMNMGGD